MSCALTLVALSLLSNEVGANENPATPVDTGLVEYVEVRAHYLCDGYESYGDASFYNCAQRFFRDAVKPAEVGDLEGQWRCRSALNGQTAFYEQVIKFGHYTKGKPGKDNFADKLLVQKIFSRNPKPKKMYEDYLAVPFSIQIRFNALVGELTRGDAEWASTNWAYVQATPLPSALGPGVPKFHDTRAAFRFYNGKLLIEHVAPAGVREHEWKVISEDPRSTLARKRVQDKRAAGQDVTSTDAMRLMDELVRNELYKDGNPYQLAWTEESLKAATPVARYPVVNGDETQWDFPIAYSECQR